MTLFGLDSGLVNLITGTLVSIGLIIGAWIYGNHQKHKEHDNTRRQ